LDIAYQDMLLKISGHYEEKIVSRPFGMGGLVGFPFVGRTGFGAYLAHVPDNGILFVISASHIGLNGHGEFGYINRVDQNCEKSNTCGSAIYAYERCEEINDETILQQIAAGEINMYDELDYQQGFVMKKVAKHYQQIRESSHNDELVSSLTDELLSLVYGEDEAAAKEIFLKITQRNLEMVTLAKKLSLEVEEYLHNIISSHTSKRFRIILLNGVQINLEGNNPTEHDYFFPVSFRCLNSQELDELVQ